MTCEKLAGLFIRPLRTILQMTASVDLTGQEQIGEGVKLLDFTNVTRNVNLWIMSGFKKQKQKKPTHSEEWLDDV